MNIRDFGRALRRRWWVIVLAVVIGGCAGGLAAHLTTKTYAAQATLYVAATPSTDPNNPAYEREQVALERVKSYLPLVDDPRVLDEAVRRAALPMTGRQLATRIDVSSPLDSVLINITATDPSPALAAAEANAVGAVFADQSARLNPLADAKGDPDVVVFLVQPAAPPDVPTSVSALVTIMIGVLAGLVLGIALAAGLDARDRRVRSASDLADALPYPVLGTLLDEPDDRGDALVAVAEPRSAFADAYRRVRDSLPVLRGEVTGSVVLVASPSPGEGRTTIALNLAATAAAAGSRVLVVDADLRRPTVAARLGLEQRQGLVDLLGDDAGDVDDALWHVGSGMFDVLTSGELPFAPAETLGSIEMRSLASDLRGRYDLILVDCSPVLPVTDVASLAPMTDGALLLCRQDHTRSDRLAEADRTLGVVATPVLGTVLTRGSQSRRDRRERNGYLAEKKVATAAVTEDHPITAEAVESVAEDVREEATEAPSGTLVRTTELRVLGPNPAPGV